MKKLIWLLFFVLLTAWANAAVMESSRRGGGRFAKPAAAPNNQLRVHDVGKVWMSITNWGFFGSQGGEFEDYAGIHVPRAPDCMFPGGSNLEYLFQGALWIGVEVDTVDDIGNPTLDTLVSVGNDGWWGDIFELWPASTPGGDILVRSIRPSQAYPYGDTVDAISEQDYVAVYYDTITSSQWVEQDPNDGRAHIPLGLEIEQRSYAWSYEYAEDFILFDFDITNIYDIPLNNVWIGLYIDADVSHSSENPYGDESGAQDDICGFLDTLVTSQVDINGDTIRNPILTAWIADNDGQVYDGNFDYRSPRSLSGCRVVRAPTAELEYGFNWWISHVNTTAYDWGPQLVENYLRWEGGSPFPGGGMGTPGGDRAKYFVMSNGEFDYDQIYCNLDWTDEGWIPKSGEAANLANGFDTRYLFSFGPFETIEPHETLKLTTGYICGENLHTDPSNYETHLMNNTGDRDEIDIYYENLDFLDFATNSQWASWVYDNPGVDTEEPYADENENGQWDAGEPYRDYTGDGIWTGKDDYRGEYYLIEGIGPEPDTLWYQGDGIPDFQGPPPPPSPVLTTSTSPGSVTLLWDGSYTEAFEDNFLRKPDFEGYRIYMSRSGLLGDYTLLADFDVIDFDSTYIDTTVSPPMRRLWKQPPRRLEEFAEIPIYGPDFDPDTSENWAAHSWNNGLETIVGDEIDTTWWLGGEPFDTLVTPSDSITTERAKEYSYMIDGLAEAIGMYFAVTAYDFGNPVTALSPLESAQSINARYVYAIEEGVKSTEVAVFPNPYNINDDYVAQGFEDPDRSGVTPYDRRIYFMGLPAKSTIRIFTLDGDLVQQIEYDPAVDLNPIVYWDLISRNFQAVVSGVYIYLVESDNGFSQLGKIAIIK